MNKISKLILLIVCFIDISPVFATVDITENDTRKILVALDDSLAKRQTFIKRRQQCINILVDSLNRTRHSDRLLLEIADQYTGFNNDSALHYLSLKSATPDPELRLQFDLGRAKLLPLSGFFDHAMNIYDSINPQEVPANLLPLYYDSGRQMYSYMAAFLAGDADSKSFYNRRALELQKHLLEILPQDSNDYKFNLGEYFFLSGERGKSRPFLEDIVEDKNTDSKLRARAAHHLSTIARDAGDNQGYVYYLAQSAIADLSAATREVASLQELGSYLYTTGDINRSYNYLTEALANAVECGAPLRMIESSRSLPIIEHAKTEEINNNRRITYIILMILIVVVIILAVTMWRLYREMNRMKTLQENLRRANKIKEVYISQFLNLCSIYMDKLNQFCKIANRKITAGKVEDLYRLTKSGKFVEEQSHEFYEVFDDAFLHLYPDFVKKVNELLRPDEQIELKEGEQLNTDLRILAFMRLGIEESSRIAQVLNYSLNTIYAYRNRIKAKAINRDTFDDDIRNIQSDILD